MTNSQGTYFIQSTPGTVSVNKAYSDMTIIYEKDVKSATSTHASKANTAAYGSL